MKTKFLSVLAFAALLSSCSKESYEVTNKSDQKPQLSQDGIVVVAGTWDGEMGDAIGCNPGSICYIEYIGGTNYTSGIYVGNSDVTYQLPGAVTTGGTTNPDGSGVYTHSGDWQDAREFSDGITVMHSILAND